MLLSQNAQSYPLAAVLSGLVAIKVLWDAIRQCPFDLRIRVTVRDCFLQSIQSDNIIKCALAVVSTWYIYHPSRIIYYSSTHFVLFYHHYYLLLIVSVCFYFCSHFGFHHIFHFFMADANAIYLSPKSYYLLLINTLRIISSSLFTTHHHSLFFILFYFFFSHILHFRWLMLMPCIIQVYYLLLIYSLCIHLFSHQPIFFLHLGWLMLTSFSS